MFYKSHVLNVSCLAMLSFGGAVHAEKIKGTVQDPNPMKYSQSLVSGDLVYLIGNRPYSASPVFLICLDVLTNLPDPGNLQPDPANPGTVNFSSNGGFNALQRKGGPLGEAAIHWIVENYYSLYHKPSKNPEENAFQYVIWEIGNDFDGTLGSISATSGRINPSENRTFPPGAVGHADFKAAYEDMYAGLITALPGLSVNYRSGTYIVDLLVNDNPSEQNMVAVEERQPLSIVAPPLGVEGNAYTTTLKANSGSGPYVWAAENLPAGMSLDPVTGILSGTPAVGSEGAYSISVRDASSPEKSQTVTLLVGPSLTVAAPNNAVVGRLYGPVAVVASGGVAPYTWSSGKLPAGLTLDALTGVLAGTPATGSEGSYSITVTDTALKSQIVIFMVVSPPMPIPVLNAWGALLLSACLTCLASLRRRQKADLFD